ncbi:retrotransposon protein, putative, ty1-copia subclass, partial [Tanacetum coccineum]
DKTKNKVKNANVSPLNLGNAFADDNVGGDDVMFLGEQYTGNYLLYENVDPSKVMREDYIDCVEYLWIILLILGGFAWCYTHAYIEDGATFIAKSSVTFLAKSCKIPTEGSNRLAQSLSRMATPQNWPSRPAGTTAARLLPRRDQKQNQSLGWIALKTKLVERFDLIQTFHACKQEEGKPVAAYVVQMKGYVDQLERLGYMLPHDLIVVLYIPKPKNPKPSAKEHPAKDDTCHQCKEVSHWKRNCPVYLAEVFAKKKKDWRSAS